MGIFNNMNHYSENKIGVFYYSIKEVLKRYASDQLFKQLWNQSFVISDEFNSVFFEGGYNSICAIIEIFVSAYSVSGFSGSLSNKKEDMILQ
jgi:hypothetical protein